MLKGNVDDVSFLPTENDMVNGYSLGKIEYDAELSQYLKVVVKEWK